MAKIVGMDHGVAVQAAAGLPEEIPTGDEAKMALLGLGAIAGGLVLGAAAAGSFKHGWVEKYPKGPVPSMFEQLAGFAAWNVGMVMFGDMLLEGMNQYGARNVLIGVGAFAAFIGLVEIVKR